MNFRDWNRQPNSNHCFVCGRNNPVGLYMTFYDNGEDEVRAKQIIPAKYQGYPGIVHGGVQAAILDEIVGRVSLIEDFHRFMMSVSLEIKYRLPVPTDTPLVIVGRKERLRGKWGKASGKICLPDGRIATEAAMTLAALPEDVRMRAGVDELGWRVD